MASRLGCLTEQQRALLREAAIPVLAPAHATAGQVRASAQTATRGGATVLSAFTVRLEGDGSAVALQVMTIARERLLASLPAAERGTTAEEAYLQEYLEREAVSELAMRSLELAAGAAYALTTPLDRLISERAAELPPPHPFAVRVDDAIVSAQQIAFGRHAVTWADLPAQRVGFVAYGDLEADALALTTCRA